MKNENKQRGVTIMEMLVVIALISILVAIVFSVGGIGPWNAGIADIGAARGGSGPLCA